MPLIEVTIAEGRSPRQIRNMIQGVHDAVVQNADARPEHVSVIVHEVPRAHWGAGGATLDEVRGDTGTASQGNSSGREQS